MKHKYNWRRRAIPLIGVTDLFRGTGSTNFPVNFDLFKYQPPRFDQGQEGSCTANSVNGELRALHRQAGVAPDADFSRQLTYALERIEQGTRLTVDSGSSIAESVEVLAKYGAALEKDWAYTKANFSRKPTKTILAEAARFKISGSTPVVNDPIAFKSALFHLLKGVLIGFTVYDSFESDAVAKTGLMPLPKRGEKVLGGHAVRIIGWNDHLEAVGCKGFYLVVNSWGEGWGDPHYPGCFWMPYDFIHKKKLADDFHFINGI